MEEIKKIIKEICTIHKSIYEYGTINYQCENGDSTKKIKVSIIKINRLCEELEDMINTIVGVKQYKLFGKVVYSKKAKVKYYTNPTLKDTVLQIKLYNNKSREYYCVKKLLKYDLSNSLYSWGENNYIIR